MTVVLLGGYWCPCGGSIYQLQTSLGVRVDSGLGVVFKKDPISDQIPTCLILVLIVVLNYSCYVVLG